MLSEEETSSLQYQEAIQVQEYINRTFWSYHIRHDRKDRDVETTVKNTFEFKFGRDLIYFILYEYMTDLELSPIGIFAEFDCRCHFTPQFKKAIKEELNSNCEMYGKVYDEYFPDKSKVEEIHEENCKLFKDTFVNGTFSPFIFIRFCALIGISAGLSFLYGSSSAPYQSVMVFITAVKEIKFLKKVDDDFWQGVQNWLELRENTLNMKIKRTFQNYDSRHERMDSDAENIVENSFEYKLGKDLIRFVLQEHMTGLNWDPTGIFSLHDDNDSPFTSQFKNAIKEELTSHGHTHHEAYDSFFPDKSKVKDIHKQKCKVFKNTFVNQTFSPLLFIKFCAFIGLSAGLSYLYGSTSAPYQSFIALITAVKELKYKKKVGDNLWNEVQDYLEHPEKELKRTVTPALRNCDFLHDRMVNDADMAIETTFEFKLARDLVRFVLQKHMPGLNWAPSGIFLQEDRDSPFTPQLKEAVMAELISYGNFHDHLYHFHIPDKSKVKEIHKEVCKKFKNKLLSKSFNPRSVVSFFAFLCVSAGLSYQYGSSSAPFESVLMLMATVIELKYKEYMGDNFWNILQNWLECR